MIPERQDFIDSLTRNYLTPEPEAAGSNGAGSPMRSPEFSDEEVIALCGAAKNAAKFADLFDHGDVVRYHVLHTRPRPTRPALPALCAHEVDVGETTGLPPADHRVRFEQATRDLYTSSQGG